MEIQWEAPPEDASFIGSGTSPGRYVQFAIALRARPEQWAVLPKVGTQRTSEAGVRSTAQNIRLGKVKGFKRGEYETAVHGLKIYVRFIGEVDEEKSDAAPKRARPPADDGQAAACRAWAKSKGLDVKDNGVIPRAIVEQWHAAPDGARRSAIRSVD